MIKRATLALMSLFLIPNNCEATEMPTINIGASWMIVGYNDGNGNTPHKINAGYSFNEYFGVEVNYLDFGGRDRFDGAGHLLTKGYSFDFLAKYPLGDFSIYAKLGNLWWKEEGHHVQWWEDGAPREYMKNNGNSTTYGIGASYSITHNFSIKIENIRNSIDDEGASYFSMGFDLLF